MKYCQNPETINLGYGFVSKCTSNWSISTLHLNTYQFYHNKGKRMDKITYTKKHKTSEFGYCLLLKSDAGFTSTIPTKPCGNNILKVYLWM